MVIAKGAFTGADRDSDGLLLTANHGFIHLDESGDISTAMQTKLLHFLQEGEVKSVGSSQVKKLNVRVVASTNQSLEEKVKAMICDTFSHSYLQEILGNTGGNVSEAARLSGLSRVAVQKMYQRLQIDISHFR